MNELKGILVASESVRRIRICQKILVIPTNAPRIYPICADISKVNYCQHPIKYLL
jgi:hypothetical protein